MDPSRYAEALATIKRHSGPVMIIAVVAVAIFAAGAWGGVLVAERALERVLDLLQVLRE